MRQPKSIGLRASLSLLALAATRPVAAHSWVEQLMLIAGNGTMTGAAGFIRGYVSRAVPSFSDSMDNYLLPPNGRSAGNTILATDSLCHPSQTIGNYSSEFPMLTVSPGDFLALRYQENGHVTLPDTNPTKPLNRGTVYIYGTSQPSSDELFLDVFEKWTADGTGGNGRGRLLATRNFDDGQCYQINGDTISTQRQAEFKKEAESPQGADLWCQNDIQLPSDLAAGTNYTLYWVWSWPTFNKAGSPTDQPSDGYNITLLQYYTSCMDVAVVGSGSSQVKSLGATNNIATSYVRGQDLNYAAVLDQLEAGAFQVEVPGGDSGNSTGGNAGSGSTASSAAAATSAATAAKGDHTVYITVTETQPTVYITVTESAGVVMTPNPVRQTHTLTTYSTTFVTKTLDESSVTSSETPTATTAPTPFTPTPGESLTVSPFLPASSVTVRSNGTVTTLQRVRRA